MSYFSNLCEHLKTKAAKQTALLYGAQIISLAGGFISVPIITRALDPHQYGLLSFALAFIAFVSLFFEFGFFSAGARLLSISKTEEDNRDLTGSLLIITTIISGLFFLVILLASLYVDQFFHSSIGHLLRVISPFVIIFPFQYLTQQVCQGSNRIKELSFLTAFPKLWYLIGILVFFAFSHLQIVTILILNFSGVLLALLLTIRKLQPRFIKNKSTLKVIYKETREYGIKLYWGRIVDVSTYNLDSLFISRFVNTTSVGFYGLGLIMISPMVILSQSLTTSLFKDFASQNRISSRVIIFNTIWLIGCTTFLLLLGKPLITLLFSNRYLAVFPIIFPLSLAGFFQGMYQPFNSFLAVHRQGDYLRSAAIAMMIMNITVNCLLIPHFGILGASWASAISMCFAFFLYYIGYNRITKELSYEL